MESPLQCFCILLANQKYVGQAGLSQNRKTPSRAGGAHVILASHNFPIFYLPAIMASMVLGAIFKNRLVVSSYFGSQADWPSWRSLCNKSRADWSDSGRSSGCAQNSYWKLVVFLKQAEVFGYFLTMQKVTGASYFSSDQVYFVKAGNSACILFVANQIPKFGNF